MSERHPVGVDELGDARTDELHAAGEAASALERSLPDLPSPVSPAFTDRVMAALANEPAPSATGFLAPLRRRGMVAGFAASLRQARLAMGAGRPPFARAAALAYVLAVAIAGTSIVGATTVGLAGALGILGPAPSPSPTPTIALPSPEVTPPQTPSTEPSVPDPTTEATESEEPGSTDDHGGGSGPEPSDDHSGTSSGSDDGSGGDGSSGSGSATPRPTDTPRPTGTPKPTETPH